MPDRQSSLGADTRQHPRFTPGPTLSVQLAARTGRLRLRDIGAGGFAVTSPRPFEPGTTLFFMFTSNVTLSFVLEAKTVHCREILSSGRTHRYVAGFEFVQPAGGDEERVVRIVLDLASAPPSVH